MAAYGPRRTIGSVDQSSPRGSKRLDPAKVRTGAFRANLDWPSGTPIAKIATMDGTTSIVRREIRFLLNDDEVRLDKVRAEDTLLDFIRLRARLTGTKEGCAEGDCGACTVLVGSLRDGALEYQPINACIRLLASLDGCHVVTIEHLGREGLHPVQASMVRNHGSQCGFCTPGIVMALYAAWLSDGNLRADQAKVALQGNLCRCTGYAPILRAAADVGANPAADPLFVQRETVRARLAALVDGRRVDLEDVAIPRDVDDLAEILLERPSATIVSGATDVGLWVTKGMQRITPAVFIHHLDALRRIEVTDEMMEIGATVTYADLMPVLREHFPTVIAYWLRIGGPQIRAAGTIGGNVANGSPIGDTPPWLIAMGATLVLRKGTDRREVRAEDFFVDYGKQDLAKGEFLERIRVPLLHPDETLIVEKISKRRDEDISTVAMAARLRLSNGTVRDARIAYGGMAAIPKRARAVEAALINQEFSPERVTQAVAALREDFQPISDARASAEYRARVAGNLLVRAAGADR